MTGYGYVSLFVCSSSQSEGSAFLFLNSSILRADFFAWIIAGCWQTASQMLDQWTLRDNVIGCTQSRCCHAHCEHTSQVWHMFSKQSSWQLAAVAMETSMPFPPIVCTARYPESFFFCLGLLKLARPPVNKRLRLCFAWFVCKWVCAWMVHICACMGVSFIWPSEHTQTRCCVCAPVWTGLGWGCWDL